MVLYIPMTGPIPGTVWMFIAWISETLLHPCIYLFIVTVTVLHCVCWLYTFVCVAVICKLQQRNISYANSINSKSAFEASDTEMMQLNWSKMYTDLIQFHYISDSALYYQSDSERCPIQIWLRFESHLYYRFESHLALKFQLQNRLSDLIQSVTSSDTEPCQFWFKPYDFAVYRMYHGLYQNRTSSDSKCTIWLNHVCNTRDNKTYKLHGRQAGVDQVHLVWNSHVL